MRKGQDGMGACPPPRLHCLLPTYCLLLDTSFMQVQTDDTKRSQSAESKPRIF